MRHYLNLLLLLTWLFGILAFAQAPPPVSNAPRLGLALEGGAARGLAHIGVLQWMEEHHIPISYVAGTSMGGLVGGIYATGHGPSEIKDFIGRIEWDDVLRGEISYTDLAYRRKEDARDYPNGLEFGLRNGIRFPEGFNAGHQVGLILDSVAAPYASVKSFDELPTPFACVGSDLVSGKQHVFRDGSLSQALRATMSIPGVFSPVRTQTAVFVDGGILDNLPVDVAKDMGADIVIAVHLEVMPTNAREPLSSFDVLGRSMSVVVAANELRSIEKADILISVPLAAYTSTDYKKASELIKLGYEAADRKAALLSRFAVDEQRWNEYLAQRNASRRSSPTPEFVEVTGTKPALSASIEKELAHDVGKPLDAADLARHLDYLSGVGRFARLGYRIVEKNEKQGLLIIADEKEYSPPAVRPLVMIDGSAYDRPQFIVGGRITFLDVGRFGSEWRNDFTFGSANSVSSEFFRPIGKSLHWFVAPKAFAMNDADDYYSGEKLTAEYRNRKFGGGLDIGYQFTRDSELRVGYVAADQKLSPSVGTALFGSLEGRVGVSSLRYNLIGRNDPILPSRGFDLHFEANWYDANPGTLDGFASALARTTWFHPVTRSDSIFSSVGGGTTFSYRSVGVPPFSLGGSHDLLAYGQNEFLLRQYLLFNAGYIHRLWKLPAPIGKDVAVIGMYELAKLYDSPQASSLPTDVAGGLVVDSIFGPVLIGGAYGATGHHKFFYRLGRLF